MAIQLTKDIERRVLQHVISGSYRSAASVIRDGLALIESREAFRRAVAEGRAQCYRGELLDGEEVFQEIESRLRQARRRARA